MGQGTHCEYSLFGRSYCRKALSHTWLHFLEELYGRDPDGLRDCVPFSDWLATRNWFRYRWRDRPSKRAHEVADGLWTCVDWCNRDNLEDECWNLLERLGRRRSDFVVHGCPTAWTLLDDPRYDALVREFKRLQEENEHRPIDSFLRIKEEFMKLAEKGRGSASSWVDNHHRNDR